MAGRLNVLTPKEVAAEFHVPEPIVLAELESGRLKGFRLGGAWRTTENAALALIETLMDTEETGDALPGAPSIELSDAEWDPESAEADEDGVKRRGRKPKSRDTDLENLWIGEAVAAPPAVPIPSLEELAELEWDSAPAFAHQWPNAKEKEMQDTAFERIVEVGGRDISLVIGFCSRNTAGMDDRRHATVFWGEIGRTLYPLVQFAGANDFEETGLMASVIRDGGRKTVAAEAPLPAGYEEMPVGIYNDLITGPYSRKSRCIVAHKDEFNVMTRHALLRSRQKGRI